MCSIQEYCPWISLISNIKSCILFNSNLIYSQVLCVKYWPKIFKDVKCLYICYYYIYNRLVILVISSPLITRTCSLVESWFYYAGKEKDDSSEENFIIFLLTTKESIFTVSHATLSSVSGSKQYKDGLR